MPVSLREVSIDAKCSISTASRALSGNTSISVATRRRVEASARRLGYEANGIARSLRLQSSRLIGLVIPRVEAYNYTAGTARLHDVLSAEGYQLIVCCHNDDPELDRQILHRLVAQRVDGIVHVPCSTQGAQSVINANSRIPVVELLRHSDWARVDGATTDAEAGIYELTRHLVDRGHRRIALVTGTGFGSGEQYNERVNGFRRAIAPAGILEDEYTMCIGNFDIEAGRVAARQLLNRGLSSFPTAIVTGSAPLTLGVIETLHYEGVPVPKFVSIASLANVEWASAMNPPITTYELPLAEMGMLAAQMVLDRIRPQPHTDARPSRVLLAGRLVLRESTASPRR